MGGFNAGVVGSTNRSLAVSRTTQAYITTKFVNATASRLTQIELYYDLGCCWVTKGGGTVTASTSVQISTNGTTFVPLGANCNATVSNTATTVFGSWLSDAQMDAQKLSKRSVGGIATLPAGWGSINTGQVFYIRWVTGTQNASDKVTFGIDNLRTFVDCVPQLTISPVSGGTNTMNFVATSGKYYTLLAATNMTSTFKPVTNCVRLTGQTGQDLILAQPSLGDIAFYKVVIEDN